MRQPLDDNRNSPAPEALDSGSIAGRQAGRQAGSLRARRLTPVVAGIAATAAVCIAWGFVRFGSLHDAWLYAGGARVMLDRSTLSLPPGKVGDTRSAVFRLRNLTGKPVRVLGATVSCDCVSTEGLPSEVDAGGSILLRSSVHLDGRVSGSFEQSVTYFTDHPSAPSLRVVIRGQVLDPEPRESSDRGDEK